MSLYDEAKQAEKELFAKYDMLDNEYAKWQELFSKLHLPESCRTVWQRPEMDGSPWHDVLEVTPCGEFWFGIWEEDEEAMDNPKPLKNASASQRVAGLAHIGDLWRNACRVSSDYISTVESRLSKSQSDRMKVTETINNAAPAA